MPAAPAGATAPTGTLVLSGTGAGYADIVLPRAVRFLPMLLTGTIDQNKNRIVAGWSWTGCGTIRGFYLRPTSGDSMKGAGAVDFAGLRFGAPTDLPWVGGPIPRQPTPLGASHMGIAVPEDEPAKLPAGRYRAFLLGEGACQVRVRVDGYAGTLRAWTTRPATMQHAVRDLEPIGTMAAPGARLLLARVPVTIRRSTLGFAFLHRVGVDSAHGQFVPSTVNGWSACIEKYDSPLCEGSAATPRRERSVQYLNGTWGMPPWFETPAGRVSPRNGPFPSVTQIGTWYAPGWLAPREGMEAKVFGFSVPTATALQAAVLTLDL